MPKNLFTVTLDQLESFENSGGTVPQELIESVGSYLNPNNLNGMDELAEILSVHIKRHGFNTVKTVLGVFTGSPEGRGAVSELIQDHIRKKWSDLPEEIEVVGHLLRDLIVAVPQVRDLKTTESIYSDRDRKVFRIHTDQLQQELEESLEKENGRVTSNASVEELKARFLRGNLSYRQGLNCFANGEVVDGLKLFALGANLMRDYVEKAEPEDREINLYIESLLSAAVLYLTLEDLTKAEECFAEAHRLASELFERKPSADTAFQILRAIQEQVSVNFKLDLDRAYDLSHRAVYLASKFTHQFPNCDFWDVTTEIEFWHYCVLFESGEKRKAFDLFASILQDRFNHLGEVECYDDLMELFEALQGAANLLSSNSQDKKAGFYYLLAGLIFNKIPPENLTEENIYTMVDMFEKAARSYDKHGDFDRSLFVNLRIRKSLERLVSNQVINPTILSSLIVSLQGIVSNSVRMKGFDGDCREMEEFEEIQPMAELALALYPERHDMQEIYKQAMVYLQTVNDMMEL